ncbi:uncharacterized protein MTY_0338 [Moorella thermoacetica Y72]|uniref:Thioesterase domain-containing protein n=1 Tax=Moorella thermoacetica Y72 TaxID=1325331 RepID=A0A0S6U7E0_NEOTH|nr:hotdog fold thioesterase [Moorella thermoacetica]GAF25009.1 uncharacterized protein MTY_0338 [Moorella thermoacetica Y72]
MVRGEEEEKKNVEPPIRYILCHNPLKAQEDYEFRVKASNSHGDAAVALTVTINYLAPARPGDSLVATAEEEHLTRRTGVYRIRVTTGSGENIALARGTVYRKQVIK